MSTATTIKPSSLHRVWQIGLAILAFAWAVFTAFAGLFWEMAQVAVRLLGNKDVSFIKEDVYDNPVSNNLSGPMYNCRTGMYDDGGDPQGIYDSEFDEI